MDLRNHGCVKAESRVLRNPHARFGGRRLETQVKLCAGRLPYFLLFSDEKRELLEWRQRIVRKLVDFRLTLHENKAQTRPVTEGIPFLGVTVFPTHRRLKRRKGTAFQRKFQQLLREYAEGEILHAQLTASVQGWVNHVRYGNTWGLRRSILAVPQSPRKASNL